MTDFQICDACHYKCVIKNGQVGHCGVWGNQNGKVRLLQYANCAYKSIEPLKKKPFYHFHSPESLFLSVGFWGCNFKCNYCLNNTISHHVDGASLFMPPHNLVEAARSYGVEGIAFSHNEPTLYYDYIWNVARAIASQKDLSIAVKSNGFMSSRVADILIEVVDAFNVDIKGSEEDYQADFDCSFEPVRTNIEKIHSSGKHVELSYLVLPHRLMDENLHIDIRNWVSNLSVNIPVHMLFFYPCHESVKTTYSPGDLLEVVKIFKEKLSNVYMSNCHNSLVELSFKRGPTASQVV